MVLKIMNLRRDSTLRILIPKMAHAGIITRDRLESVPLKLRTLEHFSAR